MLDIPTRGNRFSPSLLENPLNVDSLGRRYYLTLMGNNYARPGDGIRVRRMERGLGGVFFFTHSNMHFLRQNNHRPGTHIVCLFIYSLNKLLVSNYYM